MKGIVLDTVTRTGVPGVVVTLRSNEGGEQLLQWAGTDDEGGFDTTGGRIPDRLPPADARGYVVRVHRNAGPDGHGDKRDPDLGEELAVLAVPTERGWSGRSLTLWVQDAFGSPVRLFGRLVDDGGAALGQVPVTVAEPAGGSRTTSTTDQGGYLSLAYPAGTVDPQRPLRLWTGPPERTLVADWAADPDQPEQEVRLSPAGTLIVTGRVSGDRSVAGLTVELLDRSGAWANPVATTATGDDGSFELSFAQLLGTPPVATLAVSSRSRRVATLDVDAPWQDGRLVDVTVPVDEGASLALTGQVLQRSTRLPVPGMRVEVWTGAPPTLTRVTTSDVDGAFAAELATGDGPPPVLLRLFAGAQLAAEQPVDPAMWRSATLHVFVETDLTPPPAELRLSGRVLDAATKAGVPALRVEAWDRAPRSGGQLGVSAYVAADGTFDLALPPSPAPPSLVFRLYRADALVATLDTQPVFGADGTGTVVLEVSTSVQSTDDVVLHELGETIADTVHRMQLELSRYPSTIGAYVVDALDISVPVAVRVDALGQVRTKVLEQAPADATVGQVQLRVRPAAGAQDPVRQPLDQPLSVLTELSAETIALLEARRVYSVEDLARLASTAVGRLALAGLAPGVDLPALLDKVALLALPVLPSPVRAALVDMGLAGPRAFVDAVAADLAPGLSERLGQTVTPDDVAVWQTRVKVLIEVPLPTAE